VEEVNTRLRKKILIGITGSIAAYKTPDLVRRLLEANFEVKVVITKNAAAFVSPLVLKALVSSNNVFEEFFEPEMHHLELAKWADVVLIAPASANILFKISAGVCDDLLSAIALISSEKLILIPGMNQGMWLSPATQENVNRLMSRGIRILGPAEGVQACGDNGPGRMIEPLEIVDSLIQFFTKKTQLNGKKLLITAGPTQEPIDPVRFISNRSSGKMGYALAKKAREMGGSVLLISGPVNLEKPIGIECIFVKTAEEMAEAVQSNLSGIDVLIATAAVADYQSAEPSKQKIKKSDELREVALKPTRDTLLEVSKIVHRPYLVGFCAETNNLLENAKQKLSRKNLDLIVANDVSRSDIGFDSEKNEVFMLFKDKTEPRHLSKASKDVIAEEILNAVAEDLKSFRSQKL